MTWSKNWVLVNMTERVAQGDNPAIVAPLGLEFQNYLIDPTFTNVNR